MARKSELDKALERIEELENENEQLQNDLDEANEQLDSIAGIIGGDTGDDDDE